MVHCVLLVGQLPFNTVALLLHASGFRSAPMSCLFILKLVSASHCGIKPERTTSIWYVQGRNRKRHHVNIFSFNQDITIYSHFIGQTWSHHYVQSPQFGEVLEILWLKVSIARVRENKQSTNNIHCCSWASRVHRGK